MKTPRTILLAALALACAAGSYWVTYAWQQPPATPAPTGAAGRPTRLLDWLRLTPAQREAVRALEADFERDRAALEAELEASRSRLAAAFESGTTTDTELLAQVDAVLAAHQAVERRVAEYLVSLRPHLTPAQRTRLLGHFATGVREARGFRWRHGAADGLDPGDGRGAGGPPADRGPGGRGGGRRGGGPGRQP